MDRCGVLAHGECNLINKDSSPSLWAHTWAASVGTPLRLPHPRRVHSSGGDGVGIKPAGSW